MVKLSLFQKPFLPPTVIRHNLKKDLYLHYMKGSQLLPTIILVGVGLGIARIILGVSVITNMGIDALSGSYMIVAVTFALTIVAMIYAAYRYRDLTVDPGSALGLQQAFVVMLGVYAMGSLMVILGTGIYVNAFNPSLIPDGVDSPFAAANAINELGTSLVYGSVFALIFAFFFSRLKKPLVVQK